MKLEHAAAKAGGKPRRARRGFLHAGGMLEGSLGQAAARRGLGEARLLSGWAEIAGPEAAAICAPQKISRAGRQVGGTLVLSVVPGRGPEVEMLAPRIVERVNACLGWRAVSRLKLSQVMPSGLAEGGAGFDFSGAPGPAGPDPAARTRIAETVAPVADAALRASLERLGLAIAAGRPASRRKDRSR
jgi:hypothetical protein